MGSFLSQVKRRWLLITLIALFGVGAWYFVSLRTPQIKSNKTYKVERTTVQDSLSLSGEIDAEEKVTLRFQTSGRLTWVGVKEGDVVTKYQGIASLDVREVNAKLKQYLNTSASARDTFDQSTDTNTRNMNEGATQQARDAAKRLLEDAQYDLNNAVLNVELQKLAQEYAYLYTPIEGVVVEATSPVAGVNITPAQAEFMVVNPNTLYFSATADQTDVTKLREGMEGSITLDSFPDDTFTGTINSISYVPDESESGTVYRVKIGITPTLPAFRLKMTGDIDFAVGSKRQALEIPTSTIKTESDKEYVLVSVNGKPVKTFITTGDANGDKTEVTKGLKEGDLVYD